MVVSNKILTSIITNHIVSTKTELEFLLFIAHANIHYDKDLLTLDKKIIELMFRINNHPLYEREWRKDMDTQLENLKKMEPQISEAIRDNPDIIKWLDLKIGTSENFMKEFISYLKQKTKKA